MSIYFLVVCDKSARHAQMVGSALKNYASHNRRNINVHNLRCCSYEIHENRKRELVCFYEILNEKSILWNYLTTGNAPDPRHSTYKFL